MCWGAIARRCRIPTHLFLHRVVEEHVVDLMGVLDALMQSVGLATGSQAPMHVSSLWVYPVKGCRGCQVSCAKVETTGTEYSLRSWLVILFVLI